jgi:UDP-N-acetylglucosamine transferase subunit ALG13
LIFATVGTCHKSFDRFIRAIDHLATKLSEEVIIQIGISNYVPENAKYFNFCNYKKMSELIEQANTIIAHAGFGIIGECIH